MVNWKRIKLVYGQNTIWHIAEHRVDISEVHNVLARRFIIQRIIVNGVLRYSVLGESYGRILTLILEPVGGDDMLLITAYDSPESRKRIYRQWIKR
uniref:DUF4258 domain-containing protein n=1 Tax=viral metagenome TaxID=1070528 RepID=A0A6M3LXI7_9ZZZZ